MDIQKVCQLTYCVYSNLVQAYEAEFSVLTGKLPDETGLFEQDTPVDDAHMAFVAYEAGAPIGIANVAVKGTQRFEVCEFYIIPVCRNQNRGKEMIHHIWSQYPGDWEVKQIAGADQATLFWRKAISSFKQTYFTEDSFDDPYWGNVTRQCFVI